MKPGEKNEVLTPSGPVTDGFCVGTRGPGLSVPSALRALSEGPEELKPSFLSGFVPAGFCVMNGSSYWNTIKTLGSLVVIGSWVTAVPEGAKFMNRPAPMAPTVALTPRKFER